MRRALEAHLGSRQVSRVIYGAIIGLALVVALEHDPPRPGVVVGTLVTTAVAVGLAELYSEVVGAEVQTHRRITRQRIGAIADDVAAVAFGIAFPAAFFIVAALDAIDVETAFTLAKWTGLGLIGLYGFVAARLAGTGMAGSLMQALAVGLIGGLLIGLKALVH
ncbi:MAG TPA: hypothetical protein VFQ12_06190 [Thermoleophilaceae bacterium]|nr:hypothetical protein [Thermoleophilaceae bacterium]